MTEVSSGITRSLQICAKDVIKFWKSLCMMALPSSAQGEEAVTIVHGRKCGSLGQGHDCENAGGPTEKNGVKVVHRAWRLDAEPRGRWPCRPGADTCLCSHVDDGSASCMGNWRGDRLRRQRGEQDVISSADIE